MADHQTHRRAVPEWRICSAPNCQNLSRSSGAKYCEKHYMRLRRRGSLNKHFHDNPPASEIVTSRGYVREYFPSHPIAKGTGRSRVYQHRRVFFDTRGKGPHNCHWCGVTLEWSKMEVDHINRIKTDNDPENLVPSCGLCNRARGIPYMKEAWRTKNGIEFNGVTMTISEWASQIGISRCALMYRLRRGWPLSRALTEGRGKFGPKKGGV